MIHFVFLLEDTYYHMSETAERDSYRREQSKDYCEYRYIQVRWQLGYYYLYNSSDLGK